MPAFHLLSLSKRLTLTFQPLPFQSSFQLAFKPNTYVREAVRATTPRILSGLNLIPSLPFDSVAHQLFLFYFSDRTSETDSVTSIRMREQRCQQNPRFIVSKEAVLANSLVRIQVSKDPRVQTLLREKKRLPAFHPRSRSKR